MNDRSRGAWQSTLGVIGAMALSLAASCLPQDATSTSGAALVDTIGIGMDSGSDAGTGEGSDAGTGEGSDAGTGEGSDAGTGDGGDGGACDGGDCEQDGDDICVLLDLGLLDRSEIGQDTLDVCDAASPTPPPCSFTPVPEFFLSEPGCNVSEPSLGDLGNYSGECPGDIYEQQALCEFAMQASGPARVQDDADSWTQGPFGDEPSDDDLPGGFAYPNDFDDGYDPESGLPVYAGTVTLEDYWDPSDELPHDYFTFAALGPRPMSAIDFYRQNQFERRPASAMRHVVVLGSSMMSTHNQTQNGLLCSRASTRADRRRLRGNDFVASPGWHTRVPWRLALALGRTGFTTGDVTGAGPGARDTCGNQWLGPASPMQTGVNWLTRVGTSHGLMVTDGGLINDQQSRTGGWSHTLAGLVACNAMNQLVPALNVLLAAEHQALNPFGVRQRGVRVARRPPTVRRVRQVPVGNWAGALDLAPGQRAGRCWYATRRGNGRNPVVTLALLGRVENQGGSSPEHASVSA